MASRYDNDRARPRRTVDCRPRSPDRPFTSGQQVLDPLPLIVTQSEPPHRSAPHKLTAYESKKSPRRNRLRIAPRRLTAECGNRNSPAHYGARVAPTDRDRIIDDRP